MPETASACLTAREAAAFLHLNEKKLYELANSREIPAARIGGKWLFPRALLEEWLLEQAHGGALTDRLLITGSDDPLLAATTAALAGAIGAEGLVAYSPTGTVTGLELLARRRANVCACTGATSSTACTSTACCCGASAVAGSGHWCAWRCANRA